MSNFMSEVTQKIKQKVGRAADRLRPASRQSRAVSPAPSQQSLHPTEITLRTASQMSATTAITVITQSSIATPPSILAVPGAECASPPPLESTPPAIPAYARPSSPPTILATTGSAVKGLLVALRDGSDLFLPLKAALVGVVALWDIWDVCHPHYGH